MASNMDGVGTFEMADALAQLGLFTSLVKNYEIEALIDFFSKDDPIRLQNVAYSMGIRQQDYEKFEAVYQTSGVQLKYVCVDVANGYSERFSAFIKRLRDAYPAIVIIAGNVVTGEMTEELILNGADIVKVGIGPGSICTTRVVAGVGMPQLTAVMDVAKITRARGVRLVADGGIRASGDLAKAIAAGADCVMIGSMFAGTDEAPGEVFLYQGRSYKAYRGMGSISAMARGSADRYFQQEIKDTLKLVPEGIEGQVPYKGPVGSVLHQLIGGLRASMGYTGSRAIREFQDRTQFIRISTASFRESHVHDVTITRESPNYPREG